MPSILLPPATCTVDFVCVLRLRSFPEAISISVTSGLVQPVSEAIINTPPVAVVMLHMSNSPVPFLDSCTLLFLYSSSICFAFWFTFCSGGWLVCASVLFRFLIDCCRLLLLLLEMLVVFIFIVAGVSILHAAPIYFRDTYYLR